MSEEYKRIDWGKIIYGEDEIKCEYCNDVIEIDESFLHHEGNNFCSKKCQKKWSVED